MKSHLIMGRGAAEEAKNRYPGVEVLAGALIQNYFRYKGSKKKRDYGFISIDMGSKII